MDPGPYIMSHFQDSFWVGNGVEELHRYMKMGTEFCTQLESIMSERADLEKDYVAGMHKLAKKAKKASKKCLGTLQSAWQKLVIELETEEEVHRSLSATLTQDCAKPLKSFVEAQVKQRETVESVMDKQHRVHVDKYKHQLRCKRGNHKQTRELEGCWEQLEEVKRDRTYGRDKKPVSDKDIHKLEKSARKMEESLVKAEREYRDSNFKTEEARLAWEAATYRCCQTCESLEHERLQQVQQTLIKYCEIVETIVRPTQQACEELMHEAGQISPENDIEEACTSIGTGPNQPEQLLIDLYEEDLQNNMNMDRRRSNLEKRIQGVEEEIERQKKAKQGVQSLSKAYQDTPDFCDEKGHSDVSRQLVEADSMLNMLKANHYKLLCAHAEISNAPRPTSHFSDYIQTAKDKQSQISLLRIPVEHISAMQSDSAATSSHSYSIPSKKSPRMSRASQRSGFQEQPQSYLVPKTQADGDNQLETSDDYIDMDSNNGATLQFEDAEYNGGQYIATCEVQYSYAANQPDELTIEPGDVINVTEKIDNDWWQGELNGKD